MGSRSACRTPRVTAVSAKQDLAEGQAEIRIEDRIDDRVQ